MNVPYFQNCAHKHPIILTKIATYISQNYASTLGSNYASTLGSSLLIGYFKYLHFCDLELQQYTFRTSTMTRVFRTRLINSFL